MEHANNGRTNTRLSFQELWIKSAIKIRGPFYNSGRRHGPVWDTIFVVSCAVGFIVDPLFLYIWNINDDGKCLKADKKLQTPFLALRCLVDFFYIVDYVRTLSRRRAYKAIWVTVCCRFIEAFYIAFPFPQVLIILITVNRTFYGAPSSIDLFLIQYGLRVSHIYDWAMRINIETEIGRSIKGVLGFLPFILTAHIFGALWYYLAISREVKCWVKVCRSIKGCNPITYDFPCGVRNGLRMNNMSIPFVNKLCPTNPSNATLLDFGIYLKVAQSGMSRATYSTSKLMQCLWWGLRNLSSLGSNLEPSSEAWENIFAIGISMSGILLFLIYLSQNLQTYKQLGIEISQKLTFKRKMRMINPEIDLWLSRNADVPRDMKTVIMESVRYKVEENKDVDVEDILSILPLKHKRRIMQPLCLAALNKVPMLQNRDEQVLREMCEHLKPVMYVEDNCIIREGEPLRKMLFITQGTALSYTTRTNTNLGGSTRNSSLITCLQKDDFYGAELLDWAFNFASFSDIPISTSTVTCQEKVQAFVIRAKDLKIVVSKFWWYFSPKLGYIEGSLNKQLQHFAASSLQAAWRRHKARANGWHSVIPINALVQKTNHAL